MAKRRFHWSPVHDCVMHETDGAGNTLVEYTHEPAPYGPLISEHRDGEEYVHHYDALGSTTMLTDETENVTDTFTYDAWGHEVARTGTTNTPYRWVGRWGYQFNELTEGYYIRARVYQPTIAMWTSVDPLISQFLSTDCYRYVHNNSVVMIDPSGKQGTVITVNCSNESTDCIKEAIKRVEDRLTVNIGCLVGVLCPTGRSCCDGDDLHSCIVATLNAATFGCTNRGTGLCHSGSSNDGASATLCGIIKSVCSLTCTEACDPATSPFISNCAACPPLISALTGIFLCNDRSPDGAEIKSYCATPAGIDRLAELLVHEASHSCVGAHTTTGGVGGCDRCGRPDSYSIETVFRNNCQLPP